jgi:hypothetical protein
MFEHDDKGQPTRPLGRLEAFVARRLAVDVSGPPYVALARTRPIVWRGRVSARMAPRHQGEEAPCIDTLLSSVARPAD